MSVSGISRVCIQSQFSHCGKQLLEQAASAMRNVIEGYGDHYIIPT